MFVREFVGCSTFRLYSYIFTTLKSNGIHHVNSQTSLFTTARLSWMTFSSLSFVRMPQPRSCTPVRPTSWSSSSLDDTEPEGDLKRTSPSSLYKVSPSKLTGSVFMVTFVYYTLRSGVYERCLWSTCNGGVGVWRNDESNVACILSSVFSLCVEDQVSKRN